MPQMENTCKLRAKCLKKDEPLDKWLIYLLTYLDME